MISIVYTRKTLPKDMVGWVVFVNIGSDIFLSPIMTIKIHLAHYFLVCKYICFVELVIIIFIKVNDSFYYIFIHCLDCNCFTFLT